MAEPLIRGQQQVEANIGRLLERLERLEAERAVSAGGQQPKQEEERRLREQLDRLLADRLSQLEQLQREQLRMQQELLMQQHRMPMVPVMPGPPPPPPPTQHQQQFLRQLVDERASSTGPQRRPAGESTRKSPGPQPAEPQPPSVDRAAQVVSDIRDEVRAIVRRGDSELGGGVARLLNEIDSIRSDIRAHKDRYQAMPPAEATATTSAGQSRPTTSAGHSRPTSMLPQYQSSPAMSAIEPPADRSTPAVSLSGLSRFEINGAGSGGAGAAAAPEKKRRSYPLNEYLRRDPLPDRSVYPSYDSVLEAERRQQEAAGSHKPEDSVAAAQRTLLEVRRRQKALETRAQTAERSRDGKLIYSIVDAIWQDEAAAQRARVRAIVDDVIKHGGAIRQRAVPGARRTRVQQPPEEAPLPIRAIFDAVSESELARLCSPQKAAPAGGQRRKLGPWQRMPYMHFANDVKGPITALPRQPAEEPPRRRAAPTSAVPKRREPKPPQTREEAVQAGSPPRDDRRDDGNDGDDEDGASVEGAGVRLPGYHRPPPRRPAPPTGPSRRRPSAEDAAAASQPAGRVRAGRTADAVRSRMRDEVLAEVLARMVDQRRRPSGAPPERANSAGLDALIRRMILSALLARVERAARRLAGRDVQPPGGAAFSTPEATPRDDEQPETATESTPTQRTPTPAAPAAEPSVPLSALQLLLQQRPEPPAPPPPPQPQPQPRAQAASPDSELSGGSTAEERQLPDQDIVSLPSRHSVRTPTPSLEEPSAATPPPQPQPIAQSSRMDMGCQTLQDAVSQTAVDVEAQTTLPIPGSPPQSAVPEVPPSATPSTPSSPATPTCADSISEGVWLLDRSEGQAPNIQVATEARQLLGQLDASNGEAAFDLTADQSLADPPTRSEGEFPRRAPSHRADPRRDPVLAVIAGSDGRPLYPPPPGRRHRSDAAAAAAAAAADFADSSAGSSLSEPGGPDNGDDVTDIIGDDDDDAELPPPSPPPPPAPVPSRPPPPPSSSSAAARTSEPSEPLRPSQSPPAQRESLQLRDSAAADDRTAMASTAEFSTEATDRPDVDPDAYLGLSSTATNLLSTNQAIQDAFAATADSASLGTTGPRRLTVNVPGLDPVAGSSPDEADSVSEISLGGGL
ncbi:hypothetical protein BOX15_Mlig032943g2 [Macrostomum lignano]|uniref:Uncharacterized protein n=1 Tax=Macrostomum lignano TaxID=282301 RepID=A0A267F582_9PLAT|nr:hypothetical protein BOX15_Mlig032943g2 [Macrostomum lignano]